MPPSDPPPSSDQRAGARPEHPPGFSREQRREASLKTRPTTGRSLRLLETLSALGRPATLKELAAVQGIAPATAFRLCRRLEEEGYLVREVGSRRYAIGVRLMQLGLDILRASGPSSARNAILTDLVDAIGETCNFTALVGTEVLYLDRVETRWPLRLALEPGSRVPIHCTASGKLFLAYMPEELREQVLATLSLPASTPNTLTNRAELLRDLRKIARRGFSTDAEEFLVGLVAVAVPVRDERGQVFAALACHAPLARVDLKGLIAQVSRLEAAAEKIARTFT